MIEMKFSKNDGLFRISSRDIVGFYNCSSKQERKITDIIKCYGTTKSIKEVELKNMKPEAPEYHVQAVACRGHGWRFYSLI